MKKNILTTLLLTCVFGCSQSANIAQKSLDRGMNSNRDIRNALFIKGWGLNRGLITEARRKNIAELKLSLMESSNTNTVDREAMKDALVKLEKILGGDEEVTSENFAYLALLLSLGERGDDYLDNVDMFVESQKGFLENLSKSARSSTETLQEEYRAWQPLIKDLNQLLKDQKAQNQNQK